MNDKRLGAELGIEVVSKTANPDLFRRLTSRRSRSTVAAQFGTDRCGTEAPMETRKLRIFVGGAGTALALITLTASAGVMGRENREQPNGPPTQPVLVVNDATAPVPITGSVSTAPPVRFQDFLLANSINQEVCAEIEPIAGKRKVVQQVAIEAIVPTGLVGPNAYLLATKFVVNGGDLVRFVVPEMVRETDTTTIRWGGRFDGPFLVVEPTEPEARGLAVCAHNGAMARAFAVGIIEDLP